MPVKEIKKMMESDVYEIRAGAIRIMDEESRKKKISSCRSKEFLSCDKSPERLIAFLDEHARNLPGTMLRYAIEKLTPAV